MYIASKYRSELLYVYSFILTQSIMEQYIFHLLNVYIINNKSSRTHNYDWLLVLETLFTTGNGLLSFTKVTGDISTG